MASPTKASKRASPPRKTPKELEQELLVRSEEIAALKSEDTIAVEALAQRDKSVAKYQIRTSSLEAETKRLRELLDQRDARIASVESALKEEKRTTERYLHEITRQEKMLSMICAYRTDDERRDASRLLAENLGLEEKVQRLKAQIKRLAQDSIAAIDDDDL
jgi:chromosome segregation ATPase